MSAMRMGLELQQSQRLSLLQRQELQTLLQLQQSLKHPELPEARRGLEGLKTAHQILQKRRLTGILIGGCAEAMWARRKEETLETHKDIITGVRLILSRMEATMKDGPDYKNSSW